MRFAAPAPIGDPGAPVCGSDIAAQKGGNKWSIKSKNLSRFAKVLPKADFRTEMIRAAAKELKRLRADERKRADLARKNGKAGAPRSAEDAIKPASSKRREYRAK